MVKLVSLHVFFFFLEMSTKQINSDSDSDYPMSFDVDLGNFMISLCQSMLT